VGAARCRRRSGRLYRSKLAVAYAECCRDDGQIGRDSFILTIAPTTSRTASIAVILLMSILSFLDIASKRDGLAGPSCFVAPCSPRANGSPERKGRFTVLTCSV
jgi:hypothetical protein